MMGVIVKNLFYIFLSLILIVCIGAVLIGAYSAFSEKIKELRDHKS